MWASISNKRFLRERSEKGGDSLALLAVSQKYGVISKRELEAIEKRKLSTENDDLSSYRVVRQGDFVYNKMRMWQGAFGIAPQDGLVSPAYVVATPTKAIDPRFFMYLFKSEPYMLESRKESSGLCDDQNNLPWSVFGAMTTPWPPLPTQTAIADYLDRKTAAIDALIAKKEQLIEELRKYQEAVIAEAVAPREGWRTYKVKHLFRALPKSSLPSGAGADAGSVKFYVSGEETKRVAEAMHTGTALLLADGGKATMHLAEGEFAWSDHVVCLTSEDSVTTEFIYNQLSVQRDMLDALGFRGTGLPMLDKRWLYEDLPVLLPESCDEAKRINTVIRTVREIVRSLTAKAYAAGQELRSYRAALISEAVSGKLSLDKVSH